MGYMLNKLVDLVFLRYLSKPDLRLTLRPFTIFWIQ